MTPSAPAKPGSTSGRAANEFETLPLRELETRLDTSPDGLTQEEATRRLVTYGPNEIVEKTVNPLVDRKSVV